MKKIVIVEDDHDLQRIFRSVLMKAGYEVHLFPDGRPVVALSWTPDLFILDIELPFLNGLEICRKLKSESLTVRVPVLIVSASATLLSQAKDACADAALEKPFDAAKLINIVRNLIAINTKA